MSPKSYCELQITTGLSRQKKKQSSCLGGSRLGLEWEDRSTTGDRGSTGDSSFRNDSMLVYVLLVN